LTPCFPASAWAGWACCRRTSWRGRGCRRESWSACSEIWKHQWRLSSSER